MSQSLQKLLLLSTLPLLSGCVDVMASAITSSFPTYAETMGSAPSLSQNEGRVVAFSAQQFGIGPFRQYDNNGIMYVDDCKVVLLDKSFTFFDLPVGSHIAKGWGRMFTTGVPVSFDLKAGETVIFAMTNPPTIVPPDQARALLKDAHFGRLSPNSGKIHPC